MALINCPNCGKSISEKAEKCINCGYVFIESKGLDTIKCEECGAVLTEADTICPNCGCPIKKADSNTETLSQQAQVTGVKVSKKNKNLIVGIIAIVAILIIGGTGVSIVIKNVNEKKAEQEYIDLYNSYIDNVNEAQSLMLTGGSMCESMCNLTKSVWYNAIYKKESTTTDKYTKEKSTSYRGTQYYSFVDDFNDALKNLFDDKDIQSKIESIKSNQVSVNELMKKIQNPPEGLRDCYDAVLALNDIYNGFVSLATDPSGSLSSYSSEVNAKDNDFMNKYKNLENQIPDKKLTKE